MFDLGGANAEGQGTEGTMGRGVRIAADDGGAGRLSSSSMPFERSVVGTL
jgi:hypothetical protein